MDSLQPGNPADVDRITDVVNGNEGTKSRQKRINAYKAVKEVINEKDFPN